MAIEVRRFVPSDAVALGYASRFDAGDAYTAVDQSVVCCAGVFGLSEDTGCAWMIGRFDSYPISLYRAVRNYLRSCPYRRVIATGDGCSGRFLESLGFKCRLYLNGVWLYERKKDE